MLLDAIERYGLEPLVFTISRIGGWPLIMEPDEWNEEEYSWQKVDDQYVRLTGKNAFHDVRVVDNYLDSNETEKVVHVRRKLLIKIITPALTYSNLNSKAHLHVIDISVILFYNIHITCIMCHSIIDCSFFVLIFVLHVDEKFIFKIFTLISH